MAVTKENAINFLGNLEGYHAQLKLIHWSTDNHSKHLLTDELDDCVLDCEDSVAENVMGILGEKISEGLKTLLPNNKELKGLLSELEEDVLDFKDDCDDRKEAGLVNILDDMLTNINKYKFLETLS